MSKPNNIKKEQLQKQKQKQGEVDLDVLVASCNFNTNSSLDEILGLSTKLSTVVLTSNSLTSKSTGELVGESVGESTCEVVDGSWQLPTLYRINNRGDIRVWLIGFNGELLMSSWGNLQAYQSGHMQIAYSQVTLNSTGRNLQQQAALEANNAWKRKQELDGYRQQVIEKNIYECEAMLASEFTDKCLKAVDFPVYVQPKLDGVRCRADDYQPDIPASDCQPQIVDKQINNKKKVVNLVSRGAQAINHFNHIRQQLVPLLEVAKQVMNEFWPDKPDMFRLDGELFTFDTTVNFDKLSGSTRLLYDRADYEKKVDYYIFDIDFSFDVSYPDRWSFLYTVFERLNSKLDEKGNLVAGIHHGNDYNNDNEYCEGNNNIKLVMSYVANNIDDIHVLHADFESCGYEGAIVRRTIGARSMYCYGRTTAMYKLKTFQDAEFIIIGADTAKGTENGCIVWKLQTNDGKPFKVRPCGTLEERRQLFRDYYHDPKPYLGLLYRVRFQDYTKTGIPRFPVGVGFVYDR